MIAADIGGTKLVAAVVESDLSIRDRRYQRIAGTSYQDALEEAGDVLRELAHAHEDATAIGLSLAGALDQAGNIVQCQGGVWEQLSVVDALSPLELPVTLENDGIAALLAEWQAGAAKGYQDVVLIAAGTKVGTGVVAAGEVLRNRVTGSSPQLGGIIMPPVPGGALYLGELASGHGLERASPELLALGLSGEEIAARAQQGEQAAAEALAATAHWLGLCVVSAANLFAPEVIVVGGSLVKLGPEFLGPARQLLADWGLPFPGSPPKLTFAQHGPEAGLIGAACAAELER